MIKSSSGCYSETILTEEEVRTTKEVTSDDFLLNRLIKILKNCADEDLKQTFSQYVEDLNSKIDNIPLKKRYLHFFDPKIYKMIYKSLDEDEPKDYK